MVSDEVLARLSSTSTPQSPVAVLPIPDPDPIDGHVVIGWGVRDPGNVGTLIRTAAAFGVGYAAGPDSVDPWAPKTLRAAAGGHFHTRFSRIDDLGTLPAHLVVATDARGEPVADVSIPEGAAVAVLVGDEANGLPPSVLDEADVVASVPMSGEVESLNAAVAGAIVVYELFGR